MLNPEDLNIDVLCVAPPWNRRGESITRECFETRTLQETNRILEAARAVIAPNAKTVQLLTETGSAAATIAEKAGDYDLSVIGARGNGNRRESGLGPVASRVVQHALGPVLIARPMQSEEGLRILVAVDGSSAAFKAVESFETLCDLSLADICLMYVAETPWFDFTPEGDFATASEEEMEKSEEAGIEKEFLKEGQQLIEDARKLLRHNRVPVSSRVEEGLPAEEILAEAERGHYDLIVVGATGSRDVKHRMLGSVSSRIAWDAPCSVMIVPEPGETG
jgi:nucleotide-binding universal stress UspA family protein